MKCFKLFFIFALIIIYSNNVYAVDGYKQFKFGIKKEQVVKQNPCVLNEIPLEDGVVMLGCLDFPFGGGLTDASFFFINDVFLRIAINLPKDKAFAVIEGLSKKYGRPSSESSRVSFRAVDTTPNTEAFFAFDNDTVILKIVTDAGMNQAALLIYTSKDYDKNLIKIHKKSLVGDL